MNAKKNAVLSKSIIPAGLPPHHPPEPEELRRQQEQVLAVLVAPSERIAFLGPHHRLQLGAAAMVGPGKWPGPRPGPHP